jgi:hypothetical protein
MHGLDATAEICKVRILVEGRGGLGQVARWEEEARGLDGEATRQQLLEGDPVVTEAFDHGEVAALEKEPSPEALDEEIVGLLAHGDTAYMYGAVFEDAVPVVEALEALAAQNQDARRPVFEVEDLVTQAESDMAATRAALVGFDVEVLHAARSLGGRGRRETSQEQGAEPKAPAESRHLHFFFAS